MAAGWVTAGVSALLTAFLAYRSAANLNPLNFIDAAILAGLAWGIFRKSRVCAVLALAYCVINQIVRLKMLGGAVLPGALISGAAPFVALYLLSVVGTFAWHRHAAAPSLAPTPKPAERSR